jgi:hypothetical protein
MREFEAVVSWNPGQRMAAEDEIALGESGW